MFYVQMDGERLSIETTAGIVECFDGVPLAQNFIIDFIVDNFPFIRSGRLRWYGHVMRKGDEDWVKKCMEYRVEGRIPVERRG